MLFDLDSDPEEFHDLGADQTWANEVARLYAHLHEWSLRNAQRVTRSEPDLNNMRARATRVGIMPFLWDGSEVPEEATAKFRGPSSKDYTS